MYRIVLACRGIPIGEGPAGAESIEEDFTHRPWHTNVKCEWTGSQLILEADSDYDADGRALMEEFSAAVSPYIPDAKDRDIELVSVTALPEGCC